MKKIIIKYKNCKPISDEEYCNCKNPYIIICTNNVILCENCIRPVHPENFKWSELKAIY